MLDFIRRGIKSIFAQILLGLLVVSFAVWGIGDIFTGGRTGPVVYVGETEVEAERFADAIIRQQSIASQRAGQLVNFDQLRAAGMDGQVITALVREATYAEELAQRGIAVPDGAIRDTISSNPAFQDESGNFSQFAYQNVIGQQGFRPREFEALTARLLGEQILQDSVTSGVTAPRILSEEMAAFDGETRSVRFVELPAATASDPGIPDDATLSAWFEENQEQFREPERRFGQFLHVDPRGIAQELMPSDDEIRAEYEGNADRYTLVPTRTVEQIVFSDLAGAEDAASRLADGSATFEMIAAEQNVPLDELSLGRVQQDEMAEDTGAAAFALTEPGIAGPIEGIFGTVLLNVTEAVEGGLQPYEEVSAGIAQVIALDRARNAVTQKVNLLDDIRASGAEMDELSTQAEVPLVALDGLARNGTVASGDLLPVMLDPRFIGEVFAAEIGEERDIIELQSRDYVLVMIDRIVESHMPDLSAVRDRVIAAWQAEQRVASQEAVAEELVSAGPREFSAIAAELSATVQELPSFARSTPPAVLGPDLLEEVFAASSGSRLVGRNRDGGAAVLLEVTDVRDLDSAQLAVQADEIEALLSGAVARDQLEYFARALQERHGSRIDTVAVEGVFEQLNFQGIGGGHSPGGM